jgi:sigma-B regulation protein RsbU (phosphoserine phosphatase)
MTLENDFEDFFEHSLCGLFTTNKEGLILRANTQMANWLSYTAEELSGVRFTDLLSIGSKIYFETVLWPSLRINGLVDEVSLELVGKDGKRMQVLANAYERKNAEMQPLFTRFTLFKATDRQLYEQYLRGAKKQAEQKLDEERAIAVVREQFIAVLGHDLRNPLSAIVSGSSLLLMQELNPKTQRVAATINRSALRMSEMIKNILDFARVRLGGGMIMNYQPTDIAPIITQVISELTTAWPDKKIETNIQVNDLVNCDGPRVAQLLSNLVANALMHGATDCTVLVSATVANGLFQLSVSNQGIPIPVSILENLFEPFKRESNMPSQQGLGLGLYISSAIAQAHGGTLHATSTEAETIFTFEMQIQ